MPFGAGTARTCSMPWCTASLTSTRAVTSGVSTGLGPAGVMTR